MAEEFKPLTKEEALEVAKNLKRKGTGAKLFAQLTTSEGPSATVSYDNKEDYDKAAVSLSNYLSNAKDDKPLKFKRQGEEDDKWSIVLVNLEHADGQEVWNALNI
jgi:hypothetical protein